MELTLACLSSLFSTWPKRSEQKFKYLKNEKSLTLCSYHVTYAFQSESTIYSFLNVEELLAQNGGDIWNLSDCNGTWTHNHLVRKRTLNDFAKWLSVRLRDKWLWVRVQLNVFSSAKLYRSFLKELCDKKIGVFLYVNCWNLNGVLTFYFDDKKRQCYLKNWSTVF